MNLPGRRIASIAIVAAACVFLFAPSAFGKSLVQSTSRLLFTRPYQGNGIGITAIYGHVAVLRGMPDFPGKTTACDLTTGQLFPLDTPSTCLSVGGVSGDYMVWNDTRGRGSIYGKDLSTGAEFPICTDPAGGQRDVKLDGDNAIWVDYGNGVETAHGIAYINIRGMNLRTGEHFNVTNDSYMNGGYLNFDVAGGWVVYVSEHSDSFYSGYVMAYQIATGQTFQLSPVAEGCNEPCISASGLVAWDHQTGDAMNIWGCNIYDRKLIKFTNGNDYDGGPAICGNTIVWQSNKKPGGYQFIGLDLLAGTQFGVLGDEGPDTYTRYQPVDGGGVAVLADVRLDLPGAYYKLYYVQPAVTGTYSATDVYATSISQSRSDFPSGAPNVVVANGANWDDDAVAASLAGASSPVLFTGRDILPPATAAELTRLAPSHVEVVGGAASVSDAVVSAISSAVGTDTVVERTGGGNPVDTSIHALTVDANPSGLAQTSTRGLTMAAGSNGTVVVVPAAGKVISGLVIPALRGHHVPVVFANKKFSAADLRRLKVGGVKRAIIVGGTKDVSATVAKQLGWLLGKRNVGRIAGKNVYQTAARFDEYAIRHFGMKIDGVGIASASATTDSLMAALMGGRNGSLLLLTDTKKLNSYAAGELKARRRSVRHALYVGRGKRLVSRAVRRAVRLIVR